LDEDGGENADSNAGDWVIDDVKHPDEILATWELEARTHWRIIRGGKPKD